MERLILLERRKHPTWGPKKIQVRLDRVHGVESLPHVNTVGNILSRKRPVMDLLPGILLE